VFITVPWREMQFVASRAARFAVIRHRFVPAAFGTLRRAVVVVAGWDTSAGIGGFDAAAGTMLASRQQQQTSQGDRR